MIVSQLVEMIEVVLGYETKNKYILKNGNGEQVCAISYMFHMPCEHVSAHFYTMPQKQL